MHYKRRLFLFADIRYKNCCSFGPRKALAELVGLGRELRSDVIQKIFLVYCQGPVNIIIIIIIIGLIIIIRQFIGAVTCQSFYNGAFVNTIQATYEIAKVMTYSTTVKGILCCF